MKMRQLMAVCAVTTMALTVTGCSDKPEAKVGAGPQSSVPVKPIHHYEVRDGMEYGYSAAISHDAQQSGQIAPKILMFKYAGQRDGKHQVHSSDGLSFTAIECASPCEVMKVMSFIDKDYLRATVHVERMKNQPGSVANFVMDDALNGRLNPYGMGRGKQRFQVWVDEKTGYREHALKE